MNVIVRMYLPTNRILAINFTALASLAILLVGYYFDPGSGVKHCVQRVCMSVCLSVCMPVCLFARISHKRHTSNLHEIFCTCYPWPWLGSCLTTMQYVMYFRFVNDVMFSHNEARTDGTFSS